MSLTYLQVHVVQNRHQWVTITNKLIHQYHGPINLYERCVVCGIERLKK